MYGQKLAKSLAIYNTLSDIPFSSKQQPVQAAISRALEVLALGIGFLFGHAHYMGQCSSFAEVEPGLVVQFERIVASEEKIAGAERVQRGTLEVLLSLPHPDCLLHQKSRRNDIGARDVIENGIETGHAHARLEHHKCTQGCHQAVRVDVLVHEHGFVLQPLAVKYRHDRIHVGEEELDALLSHLARHQARSGSQAGTARGVGDAIDSVLDFRGKAGLSLGFAQFADDLGSRALRALLLRDRIVCASQLSRGTVPARVDAIALYFAAVAGVASPG